MTETIETCFINGANGAHCPEPSVEIMTTACMHGHTETFPVCEKHRIAAWQGSLHCTPCAGEHQVQTKTFPQVLHDHQWETQ